MTKSNGSEIPLIRNLHDLDEFLYQYASLVIALSPPLDDDTDEDVASKVANNSRAVSEMISQLSDRMLANSGNGYFLAIFKIDRFFQDYVRS